MNAKLTPDIFSNGFTYTFHRAGGFYMLDLPDDPTALAQLATNPGTEMIINQSTHTKIYEQPVQN